MAAVGRILSNCVLHELAAFQYGKAHIVQGRLNIGQLLRNVPQDLQLKQLLTVAVIDVQAAQVGVFLISRRQKQLADFTLEGHCLVHDLG